MQRGKWTLWSRGSGKSDAFPLTGWKDVTEHYGVALTFEELLAAFLVMKQQGQHVRLEWMPEAAYGNTPKVNADHPPLRGQLSPELERYFDLDNAQLETESEAMKLGFGYV